MRVFVECFLDSALARFMGFPRRQVGHENCKGNVLRSLAKWDGQAVGIVDADTGKLHSNPAEMAKYCGQGGSHGLKFMKYSTDDRKSLILIDPTLENWLFARANACRLQLRDYGLPESPHAMHDDPHCDGKPGFHRFLGDLLAADDGMKLLHKWLAG